MTRHYVQVLDVEGDVEQGRVRGRVEGLDVVRAEFAGVGRRSPLAARGGQLAPVGAVASSSALAVLDAAPELGSPIASSSAMGRRPQP